MRVWSLIRVRKVLAWRVFAVALLGGALVYASIHGLERRLDEQPESTVSALELYYFDDVASMTATADVVVRGTVQDIQPGRTLGEGPGLLQLREVRLVVDQVIFSKMPLERGSTIVVEEEGWKAGGEGYMIEGVEWSEPGQTGYYFLTHLPAFDSFRYINSQGRVLVRAGSLAPSGRGDLAREVLGMTPPGLEQALARASEDFRAGRLQRVPSIVERAS